MDRGHILLFDSPRNIGKRLGKEQEGHRMLLGLPSAVRIFNEMCIRDSGNSSAGSFIIAVVSLLSLAAIAVIAAAFYIKRKKAAKLSSPEQKGNGEND